MADRDVVVVGVGDNCRYFHDCCSSLRRNPCVAFNRSELFNLEHERGISDVGRGAKARLKVGCYRDRVLVQLNLSIHKHPTVIEQVRLFFQYMILRHPLLCVVEATRKKRHPSATGRGTRLTS